MAGPRAARLQVGSTPWVAEERSSAATMADQEIEEFSFSARNDFDWLNEHMAEIFNENHINVTEIFKTPGKLRGKTPRTIKKTIPGEARIPLSDVFSATPKGASNPFAIQNLERHQTPKVKIAVDPQPSQARNTRPASPSKPLPSPKPAANTQVSVADSGYYGSQSQGIMDIDKLDEEEEPTEVASPRHDVKGDHVAFHVSPKRDEHASPAPGSPEETFESAEEEQSVHQIGMATVAAILSPPQKMAPNESTTPAGSPMPPPKSVSPTKSSPVKGQSIQAPLEVPASQAVDGLNDAMDANLDETKSSSDGSSPIRPIVRKSSLNFASLPAREPIKHKSIGNRTSRTSHLEQARPSYFSRQTGGKSLGYAGNAVDNEDDEHDDMDIDDEPTIQQAETNVATNHHNKTYTQRLQDQINKLGQSQANPTRTSKSTPSGAASQPVPAPPIAQTVDDAKPAPPPKDTQQSAPGAFPEDDEDDWIQPLGTPDHASNLFSPRPAMPKSYSTDVMEGITNNTVGGSDFMMPKTRQPGSRSNSPKRQPPVIPDRTTSTLGHHKSQSVPSLPNHGLESVEDRTSPKKGISVSNPTLAAVAEDPERPATPKSPSRTLRDSPLKQVKNKLSSILKSSKGLLASSAAISAEGKQSLLSPSTTRLALHATASTESLNRQISAESQPLYPDLSQQRVPSDTQTSTTSASPSKNDGRRTRASIEREKAEEKRKDKEAREAKRMAEQMSKLEKAREKEREKARVFSQEQERVAAMEKQVAAQKEQVQQPQTAGTSSPSRGTRTSPRKAKAQAEAEARAAAAAKEDDVDMVDAPDTMPPPSAPRSAAPASASKSREIKRPIKPVKEPLVKSKQAPTVIRVNMGSQHSQYHPSNSSLASNLQDTLSQPPPQLKSKASQASLHTKPSLQSLKSSTSSYGRPKALELAAKRKEQEEREAQRKRDAKAEMERKRAALQEEERRQEQQRRAEVERQREEERRKAVAEAEAKKTAARQAAIEKAKQTRAPPPAARSGPNGALDFKAVQAQPPRPPSRMTSKEDLGRSVNSVLASNAKAQSKRPLQQDGDNERQAGVRGGTTYQSKDQKRIRMSEEFEDELQADSHTRPSAQPNLKGAPVRPSAGFKKDPSNKSMFSAGYTNAPHTTQTASQNLYKSTVANQHNSAVKTAHHLDTAQFSKGAIPFAPNPNPAGPSSHKTPARPMGAANPKSAAKSATRSSPRFQNGESIELPEINTDDEDEYSDDEGPPAAASWADSPDLRRALVRQETMDPGQIFGPPAALNMEEVFSKSKERWHKFRARTSSANWSGGDRLTEEDIRKDLLAREKLRRDGAWTYEMSKDVL